MKMAIIIFSGREISSNRSQSIFGMFFEVSLTYSSGLSKLCLEINYLDGLSNNTDNANPCIFMRLNMFKISKFLSKSVSTVSSASLYLVYQDARQQQITAL